jgi:hypothetical protein
MLCVYVYLFSFALKKNKTTPASSHIMKITTIIICLATFGVVAANAQNVSNEGTAPPAPLPALSSVADVVAYATDVAHKIMEERAAGAAVNYNLVNLYIDQLAAVDHQTIMKAYGQLRSLANLEGDDYQQVDLEHHLLSLAISKYSTQVDISALLDGDSNDTLRVISMHHLYEDPRVTQFLLAKLQQYELSPPNDMTGSSFMTILLCNQTYTPAVNTALAEAMTMAANNPKTPLPYLLTLLDSPGRANNKHDNIQSVLPALAVNIMTQAMAEPTRTSFTDTSRDEIENFLRFGSSKRLSTDTKFCALAVPYLKHNPTPFTALALARIGDKDSLAKVVQEIPKLNETASSGSDGKVADFPKSSFAEAQRKKSLKKFLDTIVYEGPGDKMAALQEHYQDAVFQNGVWTLPAVGAASASTPVVTTPLPPNTSN